MQSGYLKRRWEVHRWNVPMPTEPGSQGISDDELIAIRQHLQQERAFGSKRFQAMAEKTLGRPVSLRRPGRPRRPDTE
jgi:hypothetical protein